MKTHLYTPPQIATTDNTFPFRGLTNVAVFVLLILSAIGLNFGAAVLTGVIINWIQ